MSKSKNTELMVQKAEGRSHGNSRFQSFVDTYELSKKDELVKLGSGPKAYAEILLYLENEIKQSKEITTFNYKFQCFREDGAYQLNRAVEEIYGAATNVGRETPSSRKPVEMLDVKLANGRRLKVPFGKMDISELGEEAYINIYYDQNSTTLFVEGCCELRYRIIIDNIINRTEELLATDSIYKNQAFEIDSNFTPMVIDLSSIDQEFMILDETTEFDLQPLRSRIQFPEECIKKNIPLKYGCLLEGPYGTGKTLLAFKLAQDAIKNNWSFIYLKDPTLLSKTLRIAKLLDKNGHGIIIFCEDIDQVTRGERNESLQTILNTLDGGDTKGMNVISLFTTNHIELIEPTFLRGKRIGSIVSMGFLKGSTAREFLEYNFTKDGYSLEEDVTEVCSFIEAQNIAPAFMAEIVESIKSKMIFSKENVVKNANIRHSVDSYLKQVELSRKKEPNLSAGDILANTLPGIILGPLSKEKKVFMDELVEKTAARVKEKMKG